MITSNSLSIGFKGLFLAGNNTEDKDNRTRANINAYTDSKMGNDLLGIDKDVARARQTSVLDNFSGKILAAKNVDAIVDIEKHNGQDRLAVLLTRKQDTNILGAIWLEKIKEGLSYTADLITNGKEIKPEGIIANSTQALINLIDDLSTRFLQAEGTHLTDRIDEEWSSFRELVDKSLDAHFGEIRNTPVSGLKDGFIQTEDKITELLNKASDTVLTVNSLVNRSSGMNIPDKDITSATTNTIKSIHTNWDDFVAQLKTQLEDYTAKLNSSEAPDSVKNLWKISNNSIQCHLTYMTTGVIEATNYIKANSQ